MLMDFKAFLNLETVGWLFLALGWVSQTYIAYGKRSTRTGKTGLVLMLLGFLTLTVALFVETRAFTPLVVIHMIVSLAAWMVYVRRR